MRSATHVFLVALSIDYNEGATANRQFAGGPLSAG
jgi:hypothetical protein